MNLAPTPQPGRISALLTSPTGRLIPIVGAIIAIWVYFSIQSSVFLTSVNLVNLSNQISVTCLIALALSLVVIARQIDLSVSVLAAVAGGIAAKLVVSSHWSAWAAVAAALLVGAVSGTVQSTLALTLQVPSFIVTLGGYFILSAVLLWLVPSTGVIPLAASPLARIASTSLSGAGSYIYVAAFCALFGLLRWGRQRSLSRAGLASTNLLLGTVLPVVVVAGVLAAVVGAVFDVQAGIPVPFLIAFSLVAILSYVTTQTPVGRHLYAIGSNPEAARRAGIHVKTFTVAVFALSSILVALAGVILASRQLGVAAQTSDFTVLLDALAAIVIGGVSLNGGVGTVWAALTGSIVIGSIDNGLFLITASTQVRWSVEGLVLVGAVALDAFLSRRTASWSGGGKRRLARR